jgi:tryptophan-rich sensory protein
MQLDSQFVVSVLQFYAILIGVNIPAPFLGLKFEESTTPRLWFQPPDLVIPVIWFILFTLLGIARQILVDRAVDYTGWLFVLAILCAAYAYYTLGLAGLSGISALWFGLIGNIMVIVFALIVFGILLPVASSAAWLIFPIVLWTSFATLIVLGQMYDQKLL